MLNLITNRIFPTSGEILVDGQPVCENDRVLSKIYCMSEQPLYPDSMSVRDVFKWTKVFYPDMDMEYARMLADRFALNAGKTPENTVHGIRVHIQDYSGAVVQCAGIAAG